MKILVLTSRYTATRDIIGEDFGRQTRLFSSLKRFNHEIHFFCADYRKFENKNLSLHGLKVFIRPFGIFYFPMFISGLKKIMAREKYDLVIATSDPLWGSVGYFISKMYGVKFLYDLHDNYETYATYKLPLFKYLDRFVVKKSDLVTTVSYSLKNKIKNIRKKNVIVIENGVDFATFKPMNRLYCRKGLGLPLKGKLIGYAGGISENRGIVELVKAFISLSKNNQSIYLVIAGRFYEGESEEINLKYPNVIYMGSLTQQKVAKLINAADVVVYPNTENNFSKYCFPYKIVEYMACNTPIVATNVGDISIVLSRHKESLCEPQNIRQMANRIMAQLNRKKINYRKDIKDYSWDKIASKLHNFILKKDS